MNIEAVNAPAAVLTRGLISRSSVLGLWCPQPGPRMLSRLAAGNCASLKNRPLFGAYGRGNSPRRRNYPQFNQHAHPVCVRMVHDNLAVDNLVHE
jgi:hypothetical protein